ncbi:hypothetical protein Pint_10412 [Pistacia integerrima]|uniref:Uncharacterized protein n=1 Tax=Pistacia integerrima TaxID=434235 RepID=A0ACC0XFU9_9ROSI|nr:hypothetical protein Pint_10412 [Pistacia integerrima]
MYASHSRTRAMQLKEEITLIQRGNRSIPDYLHAVKALADAIGIIDHPISDDDLTLYVLNELGLNFRDIVAPIRAREKSIAFEELHDLVVSHKSYLRRMEATAQQLPVTANFTARQNNPSGSHQSKGSHKFYRPSRQQGSARDSNAQHKDQHRSNNSGQSNNRRFQPKC